MNGASVLWWSADARDGSGTDLPEAEDLREEPGVRDVSVSANRYGLVQSPGAVVAIVEHAECGLLRGGAERGVGTIRSCSGVFRYQPRV